MSRHIMKGKFDVQFLIDDNLNKYDSSFFPTFKKDLSKAIRDRRIKRKDHNIAFIVACTEWCKKQKFKVIRHRLVVEHSSIDHDFYGMTVSVNLLNEPMPNAFGHPNLKNHSVNGKSYIPLYSKHCLERLLERGSLHHKFLFLWDEPIWVVNPYSISFTKDWGFRVCTWQIANTSAENATSIAFLPYKLVGDYIIYTSYLLKGFNGVPLDCNSDEHVNDNALKTQLALITDTYKDTLAYIYNECTLEMIPMTSIDYTK